LMCRVICNPFCATGLLLSAAHRSRPAACRLLPAACRLPPPASAACACRLLSASII